MITGIQISDIWEAIKNKELGKHLPDGSYFHRSALQLVNPSLESLLITLIPKDYGSWDVVKFSWKDKSISFLWYPQFTELPHPELKQALKFFPETGRYKITNYEKSSNPPILHRKELLVVPNHPLRSEWAGLTEAEEKAGLYQNTQTIGFKANWKKLLEKKNLTYQGHMLVSTDKSASTKVDVDRHRTAIARTTFSKPIQMLLNYGLLTKEKSFFDYGCGQGDDVRGLMSLEYPASGWDPVHRPQEAKKQADIVNLGFVINVIEDPAERIEVLHQAFELAKEVLAVSALITNTTTAINVRSFGDGILTSRNTFQKFYDQQELAQLLEDTLQSPFLPVAPGVFLVFKRQEDYEAFLSKKMQRLFAWEQWGLKISWTKSDRIKLFKEELFKKHQELLEAYWAKVLNLGRFPLEDEWPQAEALKAAFGSLKRVNEWLFDHFHREPFEKAYHQRRKELIVYLALSHFKRQIPFTLLPKTLQWDIKAFFGNYQAARNESREILFQIGKPEIIAKLCDATPFGRLDNQALYVDRNQVEDLDPVLRIYIGVGELLYGDYHNAHEIKIHKRSGKVSFLIYEDYGKQKNPLLKERIKVDLGRQKVIVIITS